MCPFSECCSLRTGNISITLSHNHSAFACCSPYILRELWKCYLLMNNECWIPGLPPHCLKTPHCGFRVADRRPEVSIRKLSGVLTDTCKKKKKTHANDNNNAFRYGYYEANTMWSMVKAQHWTTVHITHNKSVLVHVGTLMSNYCPSPVHMRKFVGNNSTLPHPHLQISTFW